MKELPPNSPKRRFRVPRRLRPIDPRLAEARQPARSLFKRLTGLRGIFWMLQITLLAAVAQEFLLRPILRKGEPIEGAAPARAFRPGPPVVPVGESAPLPNGLSEVVTARYASLDNLPSGAGLAQHSQRLVSETGRLPVEIVNSIGMTFRLIPSGSYLMGSPESEPGRWDKEEQHAVTLQMPFYMGKTEVTQAQWKRVMGTNPAWFQDPAKPVEKITWYDCITFTKRLCELENVPPGSYRLPFEEEWEFACRGGSRETFFFGSDRMRLHEFAEYQANNNSGTRALGRRRPNAYGLLGMHGNVMEWCANEFVDFTTRKPLPERERWRSVRGGAWRSPWDECRSANRALLGPESQGNVLGFRVLRTIEDFAPAELPEEAPTPEAAPAEPMGAEAADVEPPEPEDAEWCGRDRHSPRCFPA